MSGSRQGIRVVGVVLAGASVVAAVATPGLADKPGVVQGTTDCTPFTGPKWVNPYPPNESGHHYQVVVAGPGVTCKWAHPYVVKFIAEKIKSTAKFGMPQGPVKGGPAGYKCTSGIANNGTAYQGGCLQAHPKPGSTLTAAFNWGPYNDS